MIALRRPTLTLELRGGFANQLFQWAFADGASEKFNAHLQIDGRQVSRPHDRGDALAALELCQHHLSTTQRAQTLWKMTHRMVGSAAVTHISARMRPLSRGQLRTADCAKVESLLGQGISVTFNGYAQEPAILQFVTPERREKIKEAVLNHPDAIGQSPSRNYAAVHVRRGDYASISSVRSHYGTCSLDYYQSAIDACGSSNVKVVSDDPLWCRENFSHTTKEIQIMPSTSIYQDMGTLIDARELILSNSTYSWWAGLLSDAAQVIAPDPWNNIDDGFGRLLPDSWSRMEKLPR